MPRSAETRARIFRQRLATQVELAEALRAEGHTVEFHHSAFHVTTKAGAKGRAKYLPTAARRAGLSLNFYDRETHARIQYLLGQW